MSGRRTARSEVPWMQDSLGRNHHFAITVLHSVTQGLGAESGKDGGMDSSDPGAREERSGSLPRHGEAAVCG